MNQDPVEELFDALLNQSPQQRAQTISATEYPQSIKDAAIRLVKAYESKSELLNQDLLTDIANADPEFFTDFADENEIVYEPGDRIKDYVIQSVVGEGGMSVVYLAEQREPIKRQLALKLIRPSVFSPKAVIRFFREQQALAVVTHPNVATLYEVGATDDGHPFAAIEYVNGLPINAFCEKYNLKSRDRIELFIQACEGLAEAHNHGVIHRDVKPDNILVSEGPVPVAKIIDFGIAKLNRADLVANQTMTQFGQILGSPRYMSPEQFDGKVVDHRSDLYSAALVLFELISRTPYRKGDTTEEIIDEVRKQEPELLSQRIKRFQIAVDDPKWHDESVAAVSRFARKDFDWVLAKALAQDPVNRYQNLDQFIKDVRAALNDEPVSVNRPAFTQRVRSFYRSNPWIAPASLVLLLLIGCAFGFYKWRTSEVQLSQVSNSRTESIAQNAAASSLIMGLLATDNIYGMTSDQFDSELKPFYENQYLKIKAAGGPKTGEESTVYGILALLHALSGKFDEAEAIMNDVSTHEHSGLKVIRSKICREYAKSAKEKLAELDDPKDAMERARQQVTLGRCYLVSQMFDDAKSLLIEAIAFFDSNDPGCYESLIARLTLVRIYDQAKERENKMALLLETYHKFKGESELVATEKGDTAFISIKKGLADEDPQNYGRLLR